ncbi:MAG: hypothetical protein QOJ45_453 [Verrucomicrobiota bacterium]
MLAYLVLEVGDMTRHKLDDPIYDLRGKLLDIGTNENDFVVFGFIDEGRVHVFSNNHLLNTKSMQLFDANPRDSPMPLSIEFRTE